MYNLMMLSGDASVAQGRQGAFHHLLTHFSRYWSRIDILTPHADGATSRQLAANVYIHPAPYHRALQPLFIRRQGAALMRQRPYHLVTSHDFGFFYNGIGAGWLLRGTDRRHIPLVSEIHHVEGYPLAVTRREKLWRAAAMRYLPWVARRAAALRVVNRDEVPPLLRQLGIPDEKILVLPSLYIDFATYRPLDVEKQIDVLFVGRLAANKGIDLLLEAVAQVKQTHPQITLGIRGEGPLRDAIDQFIAAHDMAQNVIFLPRAADSNAMARLYNQARALVCASTVEGGPRVTVEAMACSVPVISTRVGIMPEIIQDGESGYLVERDAAQLAGRIRALLDDPALARRIGAAGQIAAQPYDAETIIGNYARAYHALIAKVQAADDTNGP